MPTDYTNTLTISGKPSSIQEFARRCKGLGTYYPNDRDEYTDEMDAFKRKMCLEKFKEYRNTMNTGEANRKAVDETKEEMAKIFRPRTEEEIAAAIEKHRQEYLAQEPYFCLESLVPEPPENRGCDDWKRWRYDNWGCKFAERPKEYKEYKTRICVRFVAANGAITPWVCKVSEEFSDLKFTLKWDGGVEAGACSVKRGWIRRFREFIPLRTRRKYAKMLKERKKKEKLSSQG